MKFNNSNEYQTLIQFVKFCIVGASGTILSLAILISLTEFLQVEYWIGLPIGYLLGITNNFFWNRKVTFKKTDKTVLIQYSEYVISMFFGGIGYTVSTIILTEDLGVWYFLSAVLSVGISTIINFTLSKIWVFSRFHPLSNLKRRKKDVFSREVDGQHP